MSKTNEREFLAKLAAIVDEYEAENDNKVVGVYVDLLDGQPIQEWDGEKFQPRARCQVILTQAEENKP